MNAAEEFQTAFGEFIESEGDDDANPVKAFEDRIQSIYPIAVDIRPQELAEQAGPMERGECVIFEDQSAFIAVQATDSYQGIILSPPSNEEERLGRMIMLMVLSDEAMTEITGFLRDQRKNLAASGVALH
jgi:hypothetical protein